MNYARRQQYRHLTRSACYALAAAALLRGSLSVPRRGEEEFVLSSLLVLVGGLSLAALRSKRLARRWRVGAESGRTVRLALNHLADSGWMVRNGVRWSGGGDIDHLVRSPDGRGFAIETKTLTFSQEHLRRTEATARCARQRRRRYPRGVIPVLCIARARRVEWRCGNVMVVSLDRLLPLLERLAMSNAHAGSPR